MTIPRFKIAILSDLHFSSDPKTQDTHVVTSRQSVKDQHPTDDLIRLLKAERIQADCLLCPGDITLKAEFSSLKVAWRAVNDIGAQLGAKAIVASTGNHDISTRDESTPEIWEGLKGLDPTYPSPTASEIERLRYWAEHFAILEIDNDCRVVTLNTCNSHARGPKEYEMGRVTDRTLEQLCAAIAGLPEKKINVLLCHHHPAKHPEIRASFDDYSEMTHGAKLLDILEKTRQNWIVVHGHKHRPRLAYAGGGASMTPVILSAGSLSAALPPQYFPGSANQFYIVEFARDLIELGGGLYGSVRAWDWANGQGWSTASAPPADYYIASGAGFGYRSDVGDLADSILRVAKIRMSDRTLRWQDLVREIPKLEFLMHSDLVRLRPFLERKKLKIVPNVGLPEILSWM